MTFSKYLVHILTQLEILPDKVSINLFKILMLAFSPLFSRQAVGKTHMAIESFTTQHRSVQFHMRGIIIRLRGFNEERVKSLTQRGSVLPGGHWVF